MLLRSIFKKYEFIVPQKLICNGGGICGSVSMILRKSFRRYEPEGYRAITSLLVGRTAKIYSIPNINGTNGKKLKPALLSSIKYVISV